MKEEKLLEYVTRCDTDYIADINFICRMMITSALPYSKIDSNTYNRTSGNCKLSITNGYNGILPYGSYPRVILSWIITEAIRTKSREIYIGDSLSNFMKQLGILATGGKTGSFNRFKQQFIGLMTSNITYSFVDSRTKKSIVLNFHVADAIKFSSDNHDDFFKTKVVLDELFFNEIIKYPIPVDKEALNVLMSSSLALDIYFWLTYKMSYIREETEISFASLKSQFGFNYGDTKHGRYEFRRKFMAQLRFVLSLYNTAKVTINDDGICLYPSPTHVRKINSSPKNEQLSFK
ncbi:MAG: replication protein RepA [Firmicutes bacterium]|nr:replication protein RepA [Bacillota bacterium]